MKDEYQAKGEGRYKQGVGLCKAPGARQPMLQPLKTSESGRGWSLGVIPVESDRRSRQRRDLKARLGRAALTFGELRSVALAGLWTDSAELSGAVQWCQQRLLSLFWEDWEGPGCRGERKLDSREKIRWGLESGDPSATSRPQDLGILGNPSSTLVCCVSLATSLTPQSLSFCCCSKSVEQHKSPRPLLCAPHTGAVCGRIKDRTDPLSLEVPRVRSSAAGGQLTSSGKQRLGERGSPTCGELVESSCGELP